MPDVAKLKKRALEYEQKKQFDKALDTYTQVLAELDEHVDEADVALYNRVGDLLLRRGDVGEAVDHYEKAVDLYTDGGFFNNAIALCNKILRNAPGRNSVYYKLGKISARKGFINDAKQNFLEYADRMQKAGQLEEAFRALKEFADLCPDQDDIRLMLADQLVRKDRKAEAIEQLHALYDKFSAEGRSAEARATVDRMKALDPEIVPKEVVRPAPARAGDLIFLDVNYDEPARPAASSAPKGGLPFVTPYVSPAISPVATPSPTPDKAQWSVVHPSTPSETPAVPIEMPSIESDEDILIDLEAPQQPDVAPLQGLSHGAMLPDGEAESGDELVSRVDLGIITGFQDTAVAGDSPDLDIAPIEGLESSAHADADPTELSVPSMLASMELEEVSSLELPSLEVADDEPSGGDLPMLDVPLDDADDDDGVSIGGSLTFLTIDTTPELSSLPDIELEGDAEPMVERTSDSMIIEPLETEPVEAEPLAAASSITDDFGDSGVDVERIPTLEMDAIIPDGGPPLKMIDLDEVEIESFDRENALAGLPMLEPESREPEPPEPESIEPESLQPSTQSDAEVEAQEQVLDDETVEPLRHAEQADAPEPIAPPEPTVSSPTPVPPAIGRVERLRLSIADAPAAWDLRRQLAEALLEQGDRAGGITELEATMFGYEREGNLADARRSAEELIRVEPNTVRYHQKRVEYAVRANDKPQLVDAYLALAESLFRSGQLDKSRAVYGRVLELSPAEARASSALRELGVDLEELGMEPAAEGDRESGADTEAHARRGETEQGAEDVGAQAAPVPLSVEVERTASTLPIDKELFAALETALPEAPRASMPAPPQRPPIAASGDESFVNLSEWLRDEEPPKNTRMVSAGEEEPQEQQDFADMLSKFKQGVTSNVDETDHESHYDLGIAYKEMGLLEEAISEFQKALRGTEQRVRTYEALGQCFVEKRQYQIAITILQRALNDAGASDDTLVGVLYLLGYASESLKKWQDAVGYYERVFPVDIQFRDVGDRLSAVERKAGR